MIKALKVQSAVAIAAVLFFAGSVHAQTGTTVQSATFSCTTHVGSNSFKALSWSVGASSTPTSNGASGQEPKAGKAQLGTFNLVKTFDECSAALFGLLATGNITKTVTITDRGPDSNSGQAHYSASPVTVQLQDVQITQYLLSDGGSAAGPAESISFAYGKITITNLNNGSKFCWDSALAHSC